MRRLFNFLAENSWTYAGTGLVLITLTGPTLRQALWLTGILLTATVLLTAIEMRDDE